MSMSRFFEKQSYKKDRNGITYARKSVKPKDTVSDSDAILYQESSMEDYCEFHNIKIVKSYSDVGYSGVTSQRPELQEMLLDLKSRKLQVDVILFYSTERIGRDLRNNIDLILTITEYVEQIIFVVEGITSDHEYFKTFLLMMSSFAEEERIRLLKRLHYGREGKILKRGIFRGNQKALGYKQMDDGLMVPKLLGNVENMSEWLEVLTVQTIFMCYLCNMPLYKIAEWLNTRFGLTRRGVKWDIARGIATGIVEVKDHQGHENEEHYMHLDRFEILKNPLKAKDITQIIKDSAGSDFEIK